MAGKRKSTVKLNGTSATVAVIVLALAFLLITFGDKLGLGGVVPTWDEVLSQTDTIPSDPSDPSAPPAASDPSAPSAPANEFTEAGASMHVIDVGQGDSILIKTPQHNILIDASERDCAPSIISYLKDQGVTTLDYVVATHPHADHIGGLAEVIDAMDVKNVIAPKVPESITPTSKAYRTMLTSIKNKGLKIKLPTPGDVYDLEDGSKFTIVGPMEASDEMNNNSVVLLFEYEQTGFLLTGDSEKDMEAKILASGANVKADVLKLGHHGSSTSTSDEWLAAASPSFAVASCGLDNSYGHPHRETVALLKENNIPMYRTDLNGTVVFETDGKTVRVVTEK